MKRVSILLSVDSIKVNDNVTSLEDATKVIHSMIKPKYRDKFDIAEIIEDEEM